MDGFNRVWTSPETLPPGRGARPTPRAAGWQRRLGSPAHHRPEPAGRRRALAGRPGGRAAVRIARSRRGLGRLPTGAGARRVQRRRRLAGAGRGRGLRGAAGGPARGGGDRRPRAAARLGRAGRATSRAAARPRARPGRASSGEVGTARRARGGRPDAPVTRPCGGRRGASARPRSCSATPSTTRPRRCCSGSPAAPARRSLAGMPAPARPLPAPLLGSAAATDRAPPAPRWICRPGTTRTTATRLHPGPGPRTEALPALEEVLGPGVAEALARTAARCATTPTRLDDLGRAERRTARARTQADRPAVDAAAGRAAERRAAPGAAATRRSRRGARPAALTAGHVVGVDALVTAWRGQGRVDLPGGVGRVRPSGKLMWCHGSDVPRATPTGDPVWTRRDMGDDLEQVADPRGADPGAGSPSSPARSTPTTPARTCCWSACSRAR